ncbi:MAG: endopeptidase La [Lachnospiraceae bacterium]|nr:endopeptidase La [Lachnospiraceae bacterium]
MTIKETDTMPIITLNGINIFPGMILNFDVKDKGIIEAAENTIKQNKRLMVVAQCKDVKEPKFDDLYKVGTVTEVVQIVRIPEGIVRIVVKGIAKGELKSISTYKPVIVGTVDIIDEDEEIDNTSVDIMALKELINEAIDNYAKSESRISDRALRKIHNIKSLDRLVLEIVSKVPLTIEKRQSILEADGVVEKAKILIGCLNNSTDINNYKKEVKEKVKEKLDKNQRDYILREQIKVIREELGEDNTGGDADGYLAEVEKLEASDEIKEKIKIEINKFRNSSSNSSESSVMRGYIETLLSLPWDKVSEDSNDLKNAEKVLDSKHYGMEKVKERILEFLAVRQLAKKSDTPIICLVGPPGTGKTSIAKSVAEALNKKYIRLCLGGVRDEAEIRGHRRTYIGAMPGKLVKGLKDAGVKNPLMLLDEIDKVSSDYKGDVSSALLEVLDSEQNVSFADHYVDMPLDLSEVLFIATANDASCIPGPLLDRMEVIDVSSYTQNEKYHIAKNYLIKKQVEKNGLKKSQISFSAKAINSIILGYTKEAGVRSLERKIAQICRKAAKELVSGDVEKIKITDKNIEEYLGPVRYTFDKKNNKDDIGIVRGLAWTSVGGVTLQIEVNVIPGKGILKCTGQLGDVMKESAEIGLTYIRSIATSYNIVPEFFEQNDIHIHIPEGAVPKDGPSAGISMATAMLSAITKKKVRANLAMTGEVTLRGRVLAIGGLKEKLLAAKQAGITKVLVPVSNKKDVEELTDEITNGMDILFVEEMKEVIKESFVD